MMPDVPKSPRDNKIDEKEQIENNFKDGLSMANNMLGIPVVEGIEPPETALHGQTSDEQLRIVKRKLAPGETETESPHRFEENQGDQGANGHSQFSPISASPLAQVQSSKQLTPSTLSHETPETVRKKFFAALGIPNPDEDWHMQENAGPPNRQLIRLYHEGLLSETEASAVGVKILQYTSWGKLSGRVLIELAKERRNQTS